MAETAENARIRRIRAAVAIGTLAALVIVLAMLPFVLSDYGLSLLVNVMAYLVLTIAWALFSGTTRLVSLATSAFFGVGMYTVAMLINVLPLYATMQKIPRDLLQAGASLGAGPVLTFRQIFLPLSLPGVLAGCTLVFVLSLGFYITPELLGGGRTVMVSMLVSRNIELYDQWGAASAVGVVLLLAVAAIFLVVSRFVPLDRVLGQK